jgi:hypothetical protein
VLLAAILNNHVGVADQEQGQLVWICTKLRQSGSAWTPGSPHIWLVIARQFQRQRPKLPGSVISAY